MLTGNKLKIKRIKKTSKFDIPYYVSNNAKIKKFYNWEPKNNIDDILSDVYDWLLSNKKIERYFR